MVGDPPDDSDGRRDGSTGGDATIVIVGVVAGIFALSLFAALVGGAANSVASGGTASSLPTDPSSPPPMCSSSCSLFVQWECPGDRFMGWCAGVSVCDKPIHPCGTNPP
jgi:hypothetical protein